MARRVFEISIPHQPGAIKKPMGPTHVVVAERQVLGSGIIAKEHQDEGGP